MSNDNRPPDDPLLILASVTDRILAHAAAAEAKANLACEISGFVLALFASATAAPDRVMGQALGVLEAAYGRSRAAGGAIDTAQVQALDHVMAHARAALVDLMKAAGGVRPGSAAAAGDGAGQPMPGATAGSDAAAPPPTDGGSGA